MVQGNVMSSRPASRHICKLANTKKYKYKTLKTSIYFEKKILVSLDRLQPNSPPPPPPPFHPFPRQSQTHMEYQILMQGKEGLDQLTTNMTTAVKFISITRFQVTYNTIPPTCSMYGTSYQKVNYYK